MRLCIFTTDLGAVASGGEALVQRARELASVHTFDDVCFVGCRQSTPLGRDITACQPYLDPDRRWSTRIANGLFRSVDAGLAPAPLARLALSFCGASIVEAILACDPDVVLLDVRWGAYLTMLLKDDFAGEVYLTRDQPRRQAASRQELPGEPHWRNGGSSVKVSIVLPTHNGSKYLRQSIQSCLEQTHQNLELIIVDDGSTEDLRPVVAAFVDPRLQYIRHDKNQGISAALNTGFRIASGEYLTWTSDDNYYVPSAIERLTRFLRRYPGIDFVYAASYIIDEMKGDAAARVHRPLPQQDLKRQNALGACFLYTRRVYAEIGDYNSAAFLVEDYDYWVRVSKRFRMQRILSPLYYYRYHEASLTSKHTPEDVAQRFDVVKQQNRIA